MRFPLPIFSCVLFAFGACATAPTPKSTSMLPSSTHPAPRIDKAAASTSSTSAVLLAKAMPASQVVTLLGEPAEKKPLKTASGSGEIWVYRRSFEEHHGHVPAGSTTVQEFGPVGPTGIRAVTTREQPIFKEQFRTIEETTLILIVADQVIEWDQTRQSGQPYTR